MPTDPDWPQWLRPQIVAMVVSLSGVYRLLQRTFSIPLSPCNVCPFFWIGIYFGNAALAVFQKTTRKWFPLYCSHYRSLRHISEAAVGINKNSAINFRIINCQIPGAVAGDNDTLWSHSFSHGVMGLTQNRQRPSAQIKLPNKIIRTKTCSFRSVL